MARLGDVCEIYTGTGFPVEYQGNATGTYPFYKVGDISKNVVAGKLRLCLCDNYIDDEVAKTLKGTIVPEGTVVFAKIGEAVKLNRRAITSSRCLIDNNIMGIKPHPGFLDLSFFYHFMCNLKLEKLAEATTIPSIKKTVIEKIEVPAIPIATQKEIAAVLDKVSDLIALRKQQLAKLDELVKARFVEMFGDPEFNTKKLPMQKLSDLCIVGSSKRIYQNEQSSSGVPFLRVSDLMNRIQSGVKTCDLYIPEAKYQELFSLGLVPSPNDILITSRGTLGKCYIVRKGDRFYFQDGMISWLYDFCDKITPIYLSKLFEMRGFHKQIDELQAGSTVAYLSISMLKKLDVMVPSVEAQWQFAAFIEKIEQSKSTVQQGLNKLETLKSALMQEYFG